MSDPEADRRRVQEQMQQNQNLQKVQPHEVGSQDRANVINNEIDRQRSRQDK